MRKAVGIPVLCEAPNPNVVRTIFVENSVVSYPFKGKFYNEKKNAKIKEE